MPWLRKIGKIKPYKKAENEWYQKKGFKDKKDYEDNLAIIKGFGDKKERNRIWHYDKGSLPMFGTDRSDSRIAEKKIARKILL